MELEQEFAALNVAISRFMVQIAPEIDRTARIYDAVDLTLTKTRTFREGQFLAGSKLRICVEVVAPEGEGAVISPAPICPCTVEGVFATA